MEHQASFVLSIPLTIVQKKGGDSSDGNAKENLEKSLTSWGGRKEGKGNRERLRRNSQECKDQEGGLGDSIKGEHERTSGCGWGGVGVEE